MSIRIPVAFVAVLLLSAPSAGRADGDHAKSRHRHRHVHAAERAEPIAPPAAFAGGRLVLNPASNIACQTRDRGTRALPCDQPVWVYGSPCEVDLGLGRWRNCDEPPGVVHGAGRGGVYR